MDKRIIFSHHALARLEERGITQAEVISTVESGEKLGAKRGTIAFRKNFPFASEWKNRYYEIKQVMPIVMEKVTISSSLQPMLSISEVYNETNL